MQHLALFKAATENKDFRRVLFTTRHSQLVVMNLPMGEETSFEAIPSDQTVIFLWGQGRISIAEVVQDLVAGDVVCVPKDTPSNIQNMGEEEAKIIIIYAPPYLKADEVEMGKTEAILDPYRKIEVPGV